jgi:hypothetical protein
LEGVPGVMIMNKLDKEVLKINKYEKLLTGDGYKKHICSFGSREHVLSYDSNGTHCSEKDCIVNVTNKIPTRNDVIFL